MFHNTNDKKRPLSDDIEIINKVAETAEDFFHELKRKLGISMDLDKFQEIYVPRIDYVILKEEGRNNCRYVGGEFKIKLVSDDKYECSYEIYFSDINNDENIHKLSAKSDSLTCTGLTAELLEELRKEDIVFEIEEPSKESRESFYRK